MNATLFADLPKQSCMIGEFQHLPKSGSYEYVKKVIPIGELLSVPSDSYKLVTTVYDSSGIALQDLFMANEILNLAT